MAQSCDAKKLVNHDDCQTLNFSIMSGSGSAPRPGVSGTSTDPSAGDTVGYTVTVRGKAVGAGNVLSEMDASGVRGTTQVNTPVTVTR